MLLEGLHIPLTTPFFADGRLHVRKLETNVARYSLTPAAGLMVLGGHGEAEMLSDEETRAVLETAIAAAAKTKTMLAGVARASVRGTLAMVESAAALGYDGAVVGADGREGLSEGERRLYFAMVADGAALPVVLGGSLPVEWVVELASHPNVVGWVALGAAGDAVRQVLERTAAVRRTVTVTSVFAAVTRRMPAGEQGAALVSAESLSGGTAVLTAPAGAGLKTRTKGVGFQILAGRTAEMLDLLEAGAVGALPAFAAAAPQGCYEVYAAWKDGDLPLAAEKQLRVAEAARLVEDGLGVAGTKYGCDLNGYFGAMPRLPRLPLKGNERARVELAMAGLKS